MVVGSQGDRPIYEKLSFQAMGAPAGHRKLKNNRALLSMEQA
jgi:hypothetical protein